MKDYTSSTIAYYNDNHENYFKRTINIDMQSSYRDFLQLLPNGGHILDAGCGVGRDSEFFLNAGYKITALDASIEMVRLAKKRVPNVLHQEFAQMTFNEVFEGIWTCASLLHITIDDLPNIFARFISALKPKGIWYISFKYGEEQTIENGRLFSRFTINTFNEFIQQFSELSVLQVWKSQSKMLNVETDWIQALVRKEG
jgi:2-polyprenyl-3-methyl-5-hydroxy-6-metoxy-1,4-benzoquinol methylase